MSKARKSETIYYSDVIAGEKANHDRATRFDYNDGFVGISAFAGDGSTDRVLLSPKQLAKLMEFIRQEGER